MVCASANIQILFSPDSNKQTPGSQAVLRLLSFTFPPFKCLAWPCPEFTHPFGRSSWKSERSKPLLKDLGQEDDALPLIEEVLASQEQAASEMPSPEEPDQERVTGDVSDAEKKPEESSQEPQLASTPEERRHSQRERLNQILLNLLEKIPGKNGKTRTYD